MDDAMEFQLSEVGPCKMEVRVTVPAETVRGALDKSYRELRGQITLPGFRQGRVPRGILERRFGEHVEGEVAQDLVQEAIKEAVAEHDLEPISDPEFEDLGEQEAAAEGGHRVVADQPFSFAFTVEVKPRFELPEYRGVEVERREEPVTEERITEVLARTAEGHARWDPTEESTWVEGDVINGLLSVRQEEGEPLLEEEHWAFMPDEEPVAAPEGFRILNTAAALVGAEIDQTIELQAVVPDDFPNEELRGTTCPATLEVQEFKRKIVPAVDDDLAHSFEFEDLPALRADAREKLEAEHRRLADRHVVRQILEKLVAAADIPLAEGAVERTLDQRIQRMSIEFRIQGMEEEEALAEVEKRRDDIRQSIEHDSRSWFLVEKVAKKEKIFCLEDEIDQEIARLAEEHDATPAQVREYYEKQEMISGLRSEIIERKVCEFLREQAKIVEAESEPGEGSPPGESSETGSEGD